MSRHHFKNDAVSFFPALPSGWREERIHDVVELRTSNVDKKSEDGENPVRLCNYVDVYKNEKITMNHPNLPWRADRKSSKCVHEGEANVICGGCEPRQAII